jgi:hypothetical protein
MPSYTPPTIYYQTNLNFNTAIEISRFKSFVWNNKTNNQANFTLVLPMDDTLPVEPQLGGYISIVPGDVIMKIERRTKINDEDGNFWFELSGKPTQADDDITRDAKNEGYFFRYVYNGVNSERFAKYFVSTPVAVISNQDIVSSSYYDDELGGFEEVVQEGFTWGTIMKSRPFVRVDTVTITEVGNVTAPSGHSSYGQATRFSQVPFTTDYVIEERIGSASGRNGSMKEVTCPYQWITSDVVKEEVVIIASISGLWNGQFFEVLDRRVFKIRTVSTRTEQTMRALMRNLLANSDEPTHGTVPTIIRKVTGGHKGYNCVIHSKGNIQTRYWHD